MNLKNFNMDDITKKYENLVNEYPIGSDVGRVFAAWCDPVF